MKKQTVENAFNKFLEMPTYDNYENLEVCCRLYREEIIENACTNKNNN